MQSTKLNIDLQAVEKRMKNFHILAKFKCHLQNFPEAQRESIKMMIGNFRVLILMKILGF